MKYRHLPTKPIPPVRISKRLPFAKQIEKLGGIPYQSDNNRKRIKSNHDLLHENRNRPQRSNEEEEDRNIRINNNTPEINCIIQNPC